MSDAIYPISLIQSLQLGRVDRTLKDAFEDGSTASRRLWPAQYFKRRFNLTHAPLTEAEFRLLRSFNTVRNGGYDSFWFRDNVHRTGNAKVRFASELPMQYQGRARMLSLQLEEIAAIRALPELEEVATAAGATPVFWFDANREIYYTHNGTTVNGEANARDEGLTYPAEWQSGTTLSLGGSASQYQYYSFAASQWAKSAANVSSLGSGGMSVFVITRAGAAPASNRVLFGCGTGTTGCWGLQHTTGGGFAPWYGGTAEAWSAEVTNSPTNTWRSIAATAAVSGTAGVQLYANGAAAYTLTGKTHTWASGPVFLGGNASGGQLFTGDLAHLLVFAAELDSSQVAAVHALLGYQFGI